MNLTCYRCGSEFEGVPQRRYCSKRCRKAVEKARAKRSALESRMEFHKTARNIAEIADDCARVHYHGWHIKQLTSQLAAIPY